jgi:hypothetical protein
MGDGTGAQSGILRPDKAIHSLLLSVFLDHAAADAFAARFDELTRRTHYSHDIPMLGATETTDGSIKFVFDFTDHLDCTLEYCTALDRFLGRYEQFLCDVVALAAEQPFRLSALLDVDVKLATFELRIPRVPPELSRAQSFSFDYWVWHICDAGPGSA